MFKTIFPVSFMLLAAILFQSCGSSGSQQAPLIELRGVWLMKDSSRAMESRKSIADAMEFLSRHNFNVVFPSVWDNGTPLWPSTVMKQSFGVEPDTSGAYRNRDLLAELVEEAHKRGIAVIPWFQGGMTSSSGPDGGIILRKKPEWAAIDRNGKLLVKDGAAWMNPLDPQVQDFMLSLVTEVVRQYDVDGIQGSDRFPAEPVEGGYDSLTRAQFEDVHPGNQPPADVQDMHWKYWRAVRLNTFAEHVYWKVKAFKPDAVVSWATGVYPRSLNEYLQDWRMWINEGPNGEYYADIINPLIFRKDIESYKHTLDSQHRDSVKVQQKNRYLYPAILLNKGTYVVTEDYLNEAVRYNRYSGYNGEVFFSYEGLRLNNDKLANALVATHYQTKARLPFTPRFLKK